MTHWLPDFWIVYGPPIHASTHPHTQNQMAIQLNPHKRRGCLMPPRSKEIMMQVYKTTKKNLHDLRFSTVVLQKIQFIWDVMPHRLVNSYCFEESQRLYAQCQSLMTVIFTIKK
jgi:hypothetical protein